MKQATDPPPTGPRTSLPAASTEETAEQSLLLERVTAAARLEVFKGPPEPKQPDRALPPTTDVKLQNTTRLLPARYSESVLTRIADSDEDLKHIFALDNATNERLQAERNMRLGITVRELVFEVPHQRIINAAFTHPHPQGSRFSTPYRGAWYAGFDLATAKAEVLFHRMVQFAEIEWNQREELDYDQYFADFSGSFHDLRAQAFASDQLSPSQAIPDQASPGERSSFETFRRCLDPVSYIHSQQLAVDLLAAGSLGVIYPSARRSGGTCVACFRPSVVANVRKRDLYRLTWYPDKAATFLRTPRG